jgi:surface protein
MNRYTALIDQLTSGQALFKHTKWLIFFTLLSLLSACGSGSEEGAASDSQAPVISLNGNNPFIQNEDAAYTEAGANAQDNLDGEIDVVISGSLDTTTAGTYAITYTATDEAGNQATATRTIIVREPLAFITIWKTDNEGASDDNQIKIVTTTQDQNYQIDWGDNTSSNNVSGDVLHTYSTPGTYTIRISGDFKNIKFDWQGTDQDKIMSIEQWGSTQWTTMENAFYSCHNLIVNATDIPDLSLVTNMSDMFFRAYNVNADVSQWDVSSVTNMSQTFKYAKAFNGDVSSWDVSSVTDMSGLFSNAVIFNRDINGWDVSNAVDMSWMFSGAVTFNKDLNRWDVSKIIDMAGMFHGAAVFNGDISSWITASVKITRIMFYKAAAFNRDISLWNVSNVTDMSRMFSGATTFNRDINEWDVASVNDMSRMFYDAAAFNGNINGWDVASVNDMSKMFYYATAFNGDINEWVVSNVSDMSDMFEGARAFNGDISQWDVSKVINMSGMFATAKAFDRNLGQWNVSNVQDMSWMFLRAKLSTENYDALLQGWSSQVLQSNVLFDVGKSQYSAKAKTARDTLINTYHWGVYDGGLQ